MAASASFHRNVLLLTQVIPPNDEVKKHFREGMFDKPNTAGFICMSHYLLTIYDAERFKKSVEWPVACKKTEAKYRNDVKAFLSIVANENPDVGFPPILASYLLHAGGTKFTSVMWKLSQVSLRTYIKNEGKCGVLFAPKLGAAEDLAKKYLNEKTRKAVSAIQCLYKDIALENDIVKTVATEEQESLVKCKAKLFETKQSLTKVMNDAPVNPSIKKRLLNLEDTEIIQMWKTSILDSFNYIQKGCRILGDIEDLSNKVHGMVINRVNATKVLDAEKLPKLDPSVELPLTPDNQYLLYNLYKDDKLMLYNFFLLFSLILQQFYWCLKKHGLTDLSRVYMQLEACCEDMNLASKLFKNLLTSTVNCSAEIQNRLSQRNSSQMYSENVFPVMDNIHLIQTPPIKIVTNNIDERIDIQKQFELTPVEGAHKSLFSRYKRYNENNPAQTSELRSNLFISRLNLDDTMLSGNSELQSPQRRLPVSKTSWMSTKRTGKYTRLFTGRKKNFGKANCSIMSIPRSTKANSTAVANSTGEMYNVLELSLDITAKSLFNESKEVMTPETASVSKTDSEDVFGESEDVFKSMEVKASKFEINDLTEMELASNNSKSITVKINNEKSRRKSISDLVERYKKLLEVNNHATNDHIGADLDAGE